MGQKTCRACGAPLTDPAAPCSRCGFAKDPAFQRKLLQFILLFAILGILWLLFLSKGLWLKQGDHQEKVSLRVPITDTAWTKH